MSSAPVSAVDRVEHIVPRIGDRRERRRRPFPELGREERGEAEREERGETGPEEPPPRPAEPPKGEPERRVDLVVRGRFLPTGQDLPDARERRALH